MEIFTKYDEDIYTKLKCESRGYEGSKPDPKDWADLFEEDEDFAEEFNKIFNDSIVAEADINNDGEQSMYVDNDENKSISEYTPEVLQDTYLNMELALPRDDEGPEFARVTKRLRDNEGIPIGTANDNPLLDSRIYEVE